VAHAVTKPDTPMVYFDVNVIQKAFFAFLVLFPQDKKWRAMWGQFFRKHKKRLSTKKR